MPKASRIARPSFLASTSKSAYVPTRMFGVSYHWYGRTRVTGIRPAATCSRFGQWAKFGKLTTPTRPTRAVSRSIRSVFLRCCRVSS